MNSFITVAAVPSYNPQVNNNRPGDTPAILAQVFLLVLTVTTILIRTNNIKSMDELLFKLRGLLR